MRNPASSKTTSQPSFLPFTTHTDETGGLTAEEDGPHACDEQDTDTVLVSVGVLAWVPVVVVVCDEGGRDGERDDADQQGQAVDDRVRDADTSLGDGHHVGS